MEEDSPHPAAPRDWPQAGNLREGLRRAGEAVVTGFAWIGSHQAEIEQFWRRTADRERHASWDYLVKRVDGATGLTLRLGLEMHRSFLTVDSERRDDAIAGVMERGLTEPTTISDIAAAIEASSLSVIRQQQLAHALEHLASAEYELAVPAIISPLEGTIWHICEQRGLIERTKNGRFRATGSTPHPGRRIDSVEGAIRLDPMLDQQFVDFVVLVTYGGSGHSYRHGTAYGGWRVRSLCLLVSLVGCLELMGLLDADSTIRGGFLRASEAAHTTRIAAG